MRISKLKRGETAIIIGNSWNSQYIVSGVVGLILYNKKFVHSIHHSFATYRDKILKEIL